MLEFFLPARGLQRSSAGPFLLEVSSGARLQSAVEGGGVSPEGGTKLSITVRGDVSPEGGMILALDVQSGTMMSRLIKGRV